MTTNDFCFYLQNRLIQTSQTGGQLYSDTSPLSIPCCGLSRSARLPWLISFAGWVLLQDNNPLISVTFNKVLLLDRLRSLTFFIIFPPRQRSNKKYFRRHLRSGKRGRPLYSLQLLLKIFAEEREGGFTSTFIF
jgi:hypothetical protein